MTNKKDIRWLQIFSNYEKAFKKLNEYLGYENPNELERQGIIQSFEYTFELSWKVLQDLLKDKGLQNSVGPKAVFQQSSRNGYLKNGELWMAMLESRNLSAHTYDEQTANKIVAQVRIDFRAAFQNLQENLIKEKEENYSE
jgi:nucleotidyltransferase substrate binding protein (TIGR01987 family)